MMNNTLQLLEVSYLYFLITNTSISRQFNDGIVYHNKGHAYIQSVHVVIVCPVYSYCSQQN